MKIQDYKLLINDDIRDIFNNEFIEKQNILILAVEILSSRKYIDHLSTFLDKIYWLFYIKNKDYLLIKIELFKVTEDNTCALYMKIKLENTQYLNSWKNI